MALSRQKKHYALETAPQVHDQGGETELLNKHSIVTYQEADITNYIHIYFQPSVHSMGIQKSSIHAHLYTQGDVILYNTYLT